MQVGRNGDISYWRAEMGGLPPYRPALPGDRHAKTQGGMRMSLEEMCHYRHAFVDPTGGTFRGPIDEALRAKHRNRNVVLAVPTFAMLFVLMRHQPLLAFMPELVARSVGGEFAFVKIGLDTPPLEVVATWHARMNGDPRHQWLRQTLYSVAKKIEVDSSRS